MTPSEYLTENEIAAASFRASDAIVNAQTQRRHTWPAEPVVARAYLDQLRRSDVIPAVQAGTLTTTLDRAADLLASGTTGDATIATQLDTLASTLTRQGAETSGTTRARFIALASTLEGLARHASPGRRLQECTRKASCGAVAATGRSNT